MLEAYLVLFQYQIGIENSRKTKGIMADNITLEEVPFGKLDETALNNTDLEDVSLSIWIFCGEFLELCVLGLSLVGAILILYAILRFKTLGTRTNSYLMHYSVVNIAFVIATPLYELLISLITHHHTVSYSLICTSYYVDGVLLSLILTFGFLLGLDYIIACYFDKWLNTYERIQKFLIVAVYLIFFLEFVLLILPCFGSRRLFSNDIGSFIYGMYVVLLTSLHVFKCCKKPQKDCTDLIYAWKISNYVIYSWIPMILLIVLVEYLVYYLDVLSEVVMMCLQFFMKLVVYSPPVVIAFWLRFANKNFEKTYSLIFRKIARQYNQEELNEEEDDEIDTNPILI